MDEDKVCATCKQRRPLTEFNRRAAAKDGLQARCRACSRAWYEVNRVEHKRNVRARNDRVRRELRRVVEAYLEEHPCVVCGEDDLRVLEFDHRDPAAKLDAVGRLQTMAMPLARLLAEMDKCDVKCATCHRRRSMDDCRSWRSTSQRARQAEAAAAARDRLARVLPPP